MCIFTYQVPCANKQQKACCGKASTNLRQARKTRKPESSRALEVFARAKVLTTLILGRKRFAQGDFDCSVSLKIVFQNG